MLLHKSATREAYYLHLDQQVGQGRVTQEVHQVDEVWADRQNSLSDLGQ